MTRLRKLPTKWPRCKGPVGRSPVKIKCCLFADGWWDALDSELASAGIAACSLMSDPKNVGSENLYLKIKMPRLLRRAASGILCLLQSKSGATLS